MCFILALELYQYEVNKVKNQLEITDTYYQFATLYMMHEYPSKAINNYSLAQDIYMKLQST